MKEYITLVFLISVTHSSTADFMLTKFGMVRTHYDLYAIKEDYSIDSDRMNFLGFDDRQALCHSVINAKQFTHVYNSKYHDKWKKSPFLHLERPMKLSEDPDSSSLKPKRRQCSIRLRSGLRQVKCLQCVNAKSVKWFVVLSQLDESTWYLLEPSTYDESLFFRITGLFEPSAGRDDDTPFSYFRNQLGKSQENMEAICKLGQDDRLRLCSSVYMALDNKETLQEMNHIKVQWRSRKCFIQGLNTSKKVNVLPCSMITDGAELSHTFYLLTDTREPGAAFVFSALYGKRHRGLPVLKLQTRITKIGALLHPVGVKKRATPGNTDEREKLSKRHKKEVPQRKKRREHSTETSANTDGVEQEPSSSSIGEYYEAREKCKSKEKQKLQDFEETTGKFRGGGVGLMHFDCTRGEKASPERSKNRGKLRKKRKRTVSSEASDQPLPQWSFKRKRSKGKQFFIEDAEIHSVD